MNKPWRIFQAISLAIIMSVVPMLAAPGEAASSVTLSGRVYNGATGSGYGGVALSLCGAGTAKTSGTGAWQVSVPVGTAYCVRIAGGAPTGVSGPITRNNPDVGGRTTYESQIAGTNCYHAANCDAAAQQWDRAVDGGLDFIYGVGNAATPAPTAAPATPTPTPTPSATPSANGAPGEFTVKTGEDAMHALQLSWKAVDGTGITYKLERSLDHEQWTVVAPNIAETSYRDEGLAPSVHYYYRLSVAKPDGQAADYATADASTAAALAAETTDEHSFSSSDGLATAKVSDSDVPAGATCNVEKGEKTIRGQQVLLVGTYQLRCHTADGSAVPDWHPDVKWEFKLGDKAKGLNDIQARGYDDGGKTAEVKASHYDANGHTMTATAPAALSVAALGTKPDMTWVNYVVIGIAVVVGLGLVALIPLRMARKQSYQEYIRSKYYNL